MPPTPKWQSIRSHAPLIYQALRRASSPLRSTVDDDTWTAVYHGLCLSLALGTEPAATVRFECPADLVSFPSAAAASEWVRDVSAYDRTWLASGRLGN